MLPLENKIHIIMKNNLPLEVDLVSLRGEADQFN